MKCQNHELIKIHLYPIHGTCEYDYDQNYEPETLIYAGGLIVQAALLVIFMTLFSLLDMFGLWYVEQLLEPVRRVFIETNFILIIVNSLPIAGLDGDMLWRRFGENVRDRFAKFKKHSTIKKKKKPLMSPEKIVDIAIQSAKQK